MTQTKTDIAPGATDIKLCLNCGSAVSGNFCSVCGQSTSTPERLRMKNFAKNVVTGLGRLTPGFITTAKGLMLKPWDVIRDYIHGRQMRYSPPITMLLTLGIYITLIFSIVDGLFGTSLLEFSGSDKGYFGYTASGGTNPILRLMDSSYVLSTLVLGIPVSFLFYLAFYRHGARRFNFAEYLSAFLYIMCAGLIYDFFFTFLFLIPSYTHNINAILSLLILTILTTILIFKAFPQNTAWRNIGLIVWFYILVFIALMAASAIAVSVIM